MVVVQPWWCQPQAQQCLLTLRGPLEGRQRQGPALEPSLAALELASASAVGACRACLAVMLGAVVLAAEGQPLQAAAVAQEQAQDLVLEQGQGQGQGQGLMLGSAAQRWALWRLQRTAWGLLPCAG